MVLLRNKDEHEKTFETAAITLISEKTKIALKIVLAKLLIRFKKLKHAEYTSNELTTLIADYLPKTFPVSVPKGEGSFTLLSAKVRMPRDKHIIQVEVMSSFNVVYLGNPIYRAHIVILLEASPLYLADSKHVILKDAIISEIKLLQDEYSFLKDTQHIINLFIPSPFMSMFTGTMKTALSLMTGTSPADANAYLQLYLSGSKQRVLDYHKPQLEKIVTDLAASDDMHYQLDESNWEELLFAKLGKEVVVEEGKLRFKF
ncbi:MAG: hypothetical protein ACI808_002715 [Paraglaciecola sp.]